MLRAGSFAKNRTGICWMLAACLGACFGQLCWKLYARHGLWMLAIGFILYGAGALAMLIAFRHGSLSVLQPMLGLNYVLAAVLSVAVLGEALSLNKIGGIVLIIAGVVCIGGGD